MRAAYNSNEAPFGRRTSLLSAASVLAIGFFCITEAQAQETSETVTVTSTRIQREGFTAPTPVTSVSTKDIEDEAPTTVATILTDIPSFRPDSTPTTSGVNSLGGGQITANLRGLGSTRTLVLVDGKRFVPVSADGNPDLTQIPTMMVQRVEVVTGGASAAYGSDAVAGVVNFILKDHIDGLLGSVQYGESQYADDIEWQGSLAYGGEAFSAMKAHLYGGRHVHQQ